MGHAYDIYGRLRKLHRNVLLVSTLLPPVSTAFSLRGLGLTQFIFNYTLLRASRLEHQHPLEGAIS
jgi:hypothetical protein